MSLKYDCCLTSPQSMAQQNLLTTKHHSKISTSRKIKNILKPVLGKIFKSKLKSSTIPKRNSYISATEQDLDFQWITDNNLANEELENRLIEEIQETSDDSAIFIFNENGQKQLKQINKNKFYIPVHFARTNAGTFFWTTAQKQPIEPYQIEWNFLDRWAQA